MRPAESSIHDKGFTLVEMLATILIIALVLPSAMRGIALVTRMASLSNRRIVAAAFAEAKISELIASGEWEHGGLSRGNFGNDAPDYVWDIDVKNWDVSPMSELRVSVYWDGGEYDEDKCVTLTTLVYSKEE